MAGQLFSVVSNFSSMRARQDLYSTNIGLNKTLGRRASGKRIVDASGDAAGLAIAVGLKADAMALNQAVRDVNDGVAIIQIAEGALSKISNLLLMGVALAEQSASDMVGADEKVTLNVEFRELMDEIDRVAAMANFKGEYLFQAGGGVTEDIYGDDTLTGSVLAIPIDGGGGLDQQALGIAECDSGTRTSMAGDNGYLEGDYNCTTGNLVGVDTQAGAMSALEKLQTAISYISGFKGALGAQQNRLMNAVGLLQVKSLNIHAEESMIADVNMAEDIVNMIQSQILMQSGMSSLAHINASSHMVLQLLRG